MFSTVNVASLVLTGDEIAVTLPDTVPELTPS